MIAATLDGDDVYLLPYPIDWSAKPVATFSIQSEAARSLGGREARRPDGTSVCDFEFSLFLEMEDLADFRVGLQSLADSFVLCPFWPASQPYALGGSATFSSGLWLIAEADLSDWEISTTGTASEFAPSGTAFIVPLMVGVFKSDPTPSAETSRLGTCRIQFHEAGAAEYALLPIAGDGAAGAALPTGITPKVFPLAPDWSDTPEAGSAHVELRRTQIGFGREPSQTYYGEPAARGITAGFTAVTAGEVAGIASFFLRRKGAVEPFWLPGVFDEYELTSPTAADSTTVHVKGVASLGANVWIALVALDGSVQIRKIVARDAGAGTLTLDSAPAAFAVGAVRIVSALLARFKKSELQVQFTTSIVAQVAVAAIEVSNEYALAAGETMGATMGALPGKAYLFRFERRYPGGTIVDRYTSYERPVTVGSETFAKDRSIAIAHGDVVDSLEPDRITVSLSSRVFAGNPLLLLLPNQLEGPLFVQIMECEPDSSGAAEESNLLFYGRVRSATFKGAIISAEVAHVLSELSRNVPRLFIQPTCNYRLFSTACGLNEADFTTDVTVSAISGNEVTIAIGSTRAADYFAFGRAWLGSGATYQTRSIYKSTAVASGHCVLTLDSAVRGLAVGATLHISPGCDKTMSTCQTKFSNYPRYGGMPFVPTGNPSLVKITQNQTGGGKK